MALYANAIISEETKLYSITRVRNNVIVLNVSFSSRQKTKEHVLREGTDK